MRRAINNQDFVYMMNLLVSEYFYVFQEMCNVTGKIPTNMAMLNTIRDKLNRYMGRIVYLTEYQKVQFERIFSHEYQLVTNSR